MTDLLSKIFVKDYKNTANAEIRAKYGVFSGVVGVIVNFLLAAIKLVIGMISHSIAITADALNNFSDAGSSVITFVSFKISGKPADRDHPYGHARIEYVASMIVSFLILIVGATTFYDSFMIIIGKSDSEVVDFSIFGIIALASSIVLKLWLANFYRVIGKRIDSSALKASAIDSFSDCASTTGVLISAIIIKLTDLYIIDAIFGVIVSLLILYAGIGVLNQTKNSILGEAPVKETVDAVTEICARYPKILGIHDLIVHSYGPGHTFASLHVEVDGNEDIYDLHDMIDNVERVIQDELKILCCIHLDPIVIDDSVVGELREFVKGVVSEIDPSITVHDFRTVIGNTHTNLIFDVVLPFESNIGESEIKQIVADKVLSKRENHYCVITVDRG